jgi:uncharacterized lipoprotein YehR (DUF1307 family)
MKKIFNHLFIAAIVIISLQGCNDFLDEKPQGNTGTTKNFYKNIRDIEYALTATYADLQAGSMYSNNIVLMTDVRSDDFGTYSNVGSNAGREYSIKIFSAQSDNQIFRNVWAKTYQTIYRCNNVIKYIDVVNNDKLKLQYEAEARFIRALCYFNLVRLWGSVPLILTPMTATEAAQCNRSKVSDVYAAIEADLLFASDFDNLPKSFSGTNLGRATSLAAKALLGKAYLQQKKWNEAKTVLEELINTDNAGTHALLPDIANVFSTAPAPGSSSNVFRIYTGWAPQTMNKEILFEILFNKEIQGEERSALTYYASQADLNEEFKLSNTAKCIYAVTDRRVDLMRSIRGTNTDNQLLVKYADIQNSSGLYGYHTPVLRWSDVLLMYAEASNEVVFDNRAESPALKALNDVRTRSFSSGAYSTADFTSQDDFRKAVWIERRLEFPMEMQRWFDLLRYETVIEGEAIKAIKAINIDITKKDLLFPIPYTEVKLRNDPVNFPQNPGY